MSLEIREKNYNSYFIVLSLVPESNARLDKRKETHTVLAIRNLINVKVVAYS